MADMQKVSRLEYRARVTRTPLFGIFELSPICNLSCKMCYVRKTQEEVRMSDRKMMTLEEWKDLVDRAYEKGMLHLLLTGGEPFLWPHLRELYEYVSDLGLVISINSNGSYITEETLAWLSEIPPMRINITLYGASDESYKNLCGVDGVYDRVVNNIERLLSAGVRIKLNVSLTPDNAADLPAIVAFAKEKDLNLQVSTYMFPPLRRDMNLVGQNERFTPEEAAFYSIETQRLSEEPERYRQYLEGIVQGRGTALGLDDECRDPVDGKVKCGAGRSIFWVTWDGWMMPCGMMTTPKVDYRELGFDESWKQAVEAIQNLHLCGTCEQCSDRDLCHCCATMIYTETGTFEKVPKYLCEMAEAMKKIAYRNLKEIDISSIDQQQ